MRDESVQGEKPSSEGVQDNMLPENVKRQLENSPPEVQSLIKSMTMSLETMTVRQTSPYDKVAEKLTSEHVTTILELSEKDSERSYREHRQDRILGFSIFFVAICFACFVLAFFKDSPYFVTILSSLFSFLGGLGVGRFVIRKKEDSSS